MIIKRNAYKYVVNCEYNIRIIVPKNFISAIYTLQFFSSNYKVQIIDMLIQN